MSDMAAFWDARAREDALFFVDTQQGYRSADEEAFWAGGERVVDAVLDQLGLALRATDVVVDLGCGVGRLTRALAARVAHVDAVDVAPAMLAQARARNPHLRDVAWRLGDGRTLPLPDASADALLSFVVLQHVPSEAIVLGYVAEAGRVLRPGGWAALQVSDDPAVHRPPPEPARRRLAARLGRAPRGQRHPAWLGTAVDLGRLRGAAADAGLAVEQVVGEGTQFCLVALRRSPA